MFHGGPRPQTDPDARPVTGGGLAPRRRLPPALVPPWRCLGNPSPQPVPAQQLGFWQILGPHRSAVPSGSEGSMLAERPALGGHVRQGPRALASVADPAGVTPNSSFRSSRSSPATSGAGCSGRWRCSTSARDTGSMATLLGPKPPPGACPPPASVSGAPTVPGPVLGAGA